MAPAPAATDTERSGRRPMPKQALREPDLQYLTANKIHAVVARCVFLLRRMADGLVRTKMATRSKGKRNPGKFRQLPPIGTVVVGRTVRPARCGGIVRSREVAANRNANRLQ